MTEQEWLACTDPRPMLEHLSRRKKRGKGLERRLTLFGCACCRRIWPLIPTEPCRRAVDVAERYADGLATSEERCAAWSAVFASAEEQEPILSDPYYMELVDWGAIPGGNAIRATIGLVGAGPVRPEQVASEAASEAACETRGMRVGFEAETMVFDDSLAAEQAEQFAQCRLLRDIFHNPFRPPFINPHWLTWKDGTVRRVAHGIYDERAFDQLPILADALEDAGCHTRDILDHCRSGGPHVRGCWVLDLMLGKT